MFAIPTPPGTVVCTQDGAVGIITIDRPEALNTISPDVERELHSALDRAVLDDSVRVIVLTGSGERAFSAGYDLTADPSFDNAGERIRYWEHDASRTPDLHWHVMSLEKPVIAAVRGWCLAGAFWYALCCDITLAADDAVFGQPEIRETQGSTALLGFLIGWKNTARYALTGDHFDAQEALRMGVVNEVVPAAELIERAIALGRRIALVPADSVRMNKRVITFALETMGLRTAMSGGAFLTAMLHSTAPDSPELHHMFEVRNEEGMAASLKERDDKFRPEPGGPRSATKRPH